MLSQDSRTIVRRSLAGDEKASDETILFLTTDGDETVASTARAERDRRGIIHDPATEVIRVVESDPDDPWGN